MSNTPEAVFEAVFAANESGTSGSGQLGVAKDLAKKYGLTSEQQRVLAGLITDALHRGALVKVLTRGVGATFVFRAPSTDAERRDGQQKYSRARNRAKHMTTQVVARAS